MNRYLLLPILIALSIPGSLWSQDLSRYERQRTLIKVQIQQEAIERYLRLGSPEKALYILKAYRKLLNKTNTASAFSDRETFDKAMAKSYVWKGTAHLQLAQKNPAQGKSPHFSKAVQSLRKVLLRDYNPGANYACLGRVYLLQGRSLPSTETSRKKKLLKQARQYFVQAGQKDYPMAREILAHPEKYAPLHQDTSLIVSLLTGRAYRYRQVHQIRNPFRPRVQQFRKKPKRGGSTPSLGATMKVQTELLTDIETTSNSLMNRVSKIGYSSKPQPKFIAEWKKLQELLKKRDEIVHPKLQKKLNEILRDYAESRTRFEKILLSHYFSVGKNLLRKMEKNYYGKKYETVVKQWGELRQIAKDLIQAGGENFRRTSEALLSNGRDFYSKAKTYVELSKIEKKVTGILDEYPEMFALINGRWYKPGEVVLTSEGKPQKLKIKEIHTGRVTFLFQGVEISSYLED